MHKIVCCSARDDSAEAADFADLDIAGVADAILLTFNPQWTGKNDPDLFQYQYLGRRLWLLLRRLQVLCCEQPDIDIAEDLGESLIARMTTLPLADDRVIELMWAIPGMTTFLLNLDFFVH